MKIVFSPQAWVDYLHWQGVDMAMVQRINTPRKHAYAIQRDRETRALARSVRWLLVPSNQ